MPSTPGSDELRRADCAMDRMELKGFLRCSFPVLVSASPRSSFLHCALLVLFALACVRSKSNTLIQKVA